MMDLECQLTITITFLLGFGSFMVVLLSLFAGLKIRYERRRAKSICLNYKIYYQGTSVGWQPQKSE